VQRSSESVAAFASALAKAQAELVNPEKSLTATSRLTGQAAGMTAGTVSSFGTFARFRRFARLCR
jgi:hypothetical protein